MTSGQPHPIHWKSTRASHDVGLPTYTVSPPLQLDLSGRSPSVASLVFTNRLNQHDGRIRELTTLIDERRYLTQRHLGEIQWRLDEAMSRRPLKLRYEDASRQGRREKVERQITDLERQKRSLELALWRDTDELRRELAAEQRERHAMIQRVGVMRGGYGGRT